MKNITTTFLTMDEFAKLTGNPTVELDGRVYTDIIRDGVVIGKLFRGMINPLDCMCNCCQRAIADNPQVTEETRRAQSVWAEKAHNDAVMSMRESAKDWR